LAATTATKRIQDLEARVEALEEGKVKWERTFAEWAAMNEKLMQDLRALMTS
jgi:maltooligosyltrehalose synthase